MSSRSSVPVAVLDANVLYPQFLRDLLLRVAAADLFRPSWTDRIQEEWTRNLLANRPDLGPEKIARARRLMERVFPDARVTGYRGIERSLQEVHPKDRHVAAAAVRAHATHIVTLNLRDYPVAALSTFGIRPVHPDDFLVGLATGDKPTLAAVLETHRSGLKAPPFTPAAYREALALSGLPRLAATMDRAEES